MNSNEQFKKIVVIEEVAKKVFGKKDGKVSKDGFLLLSHLLKRYKMFEGVSTREESLYYEGARSVIGYLLEIIYKEQDVSKNSDDSKKDTTGDQWMEDYISPKEGQNYGV